MLAIRNPPTVRIRVGPPVEGLEHADPDADTGRIMAAIKDLLPPEAHEHRTPTPEELVRTYPSGRVPDDPEAEAGHEAERRPGSD